MSKSIVPLDDILQEIRLTPAQSVPQHSSPKENTSTAIPFVAPDSFWSSIKRLSNHHERHETLAALDPASFDRAVTDSHIHLLRIDSSTSGTPRIETVYSFVKQKAYHPQSLHLVQPVFIQSLERPSPVPEKKKKSISVVTKELIEILDTSGSSTQVLVIGTSEEKTSEFNTPLICALGDQYDVDPELCLFLLDGKSQAFGMSSEIDFRSPQKAFPSDRKILVVQTQGYIFRSQLCHHRKDPSQTLLLVLMGGRGIRWPHTSTTIDWVKDLATFGELSTGPLHDFFLQHLHQIPAAKLALYDHDPRQLVAPFVRFLALSHLTDLRHYEFSAESDNENVRARFPVELREDQDSLESRREAAVLNVMGIAPFPIRLRRVKDLFVSVHAFFGSTTRGGEQPSILIDIEYLYNRYRDMEEERRSQVTYEASIASLNESRLGIKLSEAALRQNQSVKRLTQLAFIFIPLSFITSVFGMNIDVLNGAFAKWWTVIIGAVIVYAIVGLSYMGVLGIEKLRAWTASQRRLKLIRREREMELGLESS